MKITFPLALGLLFVTLKLTGVIAWSWLWVLAPFWIGIAVFAGFMLLAFLWVVLMTVIAIVLQKPRR